ncbi:MAG: hypothetical protein IKN11_05055 [Bacteroidales bacterium]|nr:hypothetical protein [Bacteroidales bacterium]
METAIKLSAVENIAELAKESQLSPEFYRKASRFIKHLSDKLSLSGEQMENISRYYAIDIILHGNAVPTASNLMPHCDSESINNTSYRKMGFSR